LTALLRASGERVTERPLGPLEHSGIHDALETTAYGYIEIVQSTQFEERLADMFSRDGGALGLARLVRVLDMQHGERVRGA
jgi:hypothetical protein